MNGRQMRIEIPINVYGGEYFVIGRDDSDSRVFMTITDEQAKALRDAIDKALQSREQGPRNLLSDNVTQIAAHIYAHRVAMYMDTQREWRDGGTTVWLRNAASNSFDEAEQFIKVWEARKEPSE